MNNVQAHMMATTVAPLPTKLANIERMEVEQEDKEVDEGNENDNSDSSSSSSSSDSSDEASSDSSTTTSSESDETQQGNLFELAQITDEAVQLPRDLCEYESVFREFFTEELWTELTAEQRARLQAKLPNFNSLLDPNEAVAEQRHTVHLLFQDKLLRFGRTPLGELHRNLEAGHYRPDIKVWRQSIAKSQRREQRFRECERLGILAKRLFIARENLLRSVYSSAPEESLRLERTLQKQQQHHTFLFNGDTKISAVRARKRFYIEMTELKKQARLPKNDTISADEEDEEDSLAHLTQDWMSEELTALKSAAAITSSTDKCIYDTFFKRRPDFTDEESMRLSQYAKRPKLTNRNYRQYLLDYKRKKLLEPNLPDYETADIRLRDVCSRAQISGNFKRSFPLGQKPGRKGKAKLNEPPVLVPIKVESAAAAKSVNELAQIQKFNAKPLQQQPQKTSQTTAPLNQINILNYLDESNAQNDAFNVYDGEVEVQQEEVETYTEETLPSNYIVNNDVAVPQLSNSTNPTALIRALPKLEPIIQRGLSIQSKDKIKTPIQLKGSIGVVNSAQSNKKLNTLTLESTTPHTTTTAHVNSSSELIQETHACFFALIRDFFCATPNHRMKFDELKQRIQIWLSNPITALNDWYAKSNNWAALLTSAIKFLAGDFVEQPEEYVPYIDYKSQLNIYQWIGAGRDSDARLTILCNYWMEHRKDLHVGKPVQGQQVQQTQQLRLNVACSNPQVVNGTEVINEIMQTNTQIDNGNAGVLTTPKTVTTLTPSHNSSGIVMPTIPPPLPRCPTTWTVRAATAEEIHEFQRQERERFEQPHRAYTYRMYGYESVVGPVRGIYSQTLALTKARGHSMMVDDRPNFVTILTLVRDATARLPNGEGTRADISELLKCSQYINPDAAENVMQTIVSGALDRLHTESDPCVRYDPKRKIWIYLHRNRSEVEFERMHQQQQGQPKPNKFIKTTTTVIDATRKMLPKTVIKTLPARECTSQTLNNMTLPALVPANPIIITTQAATAGNKQQPTLPRHALPVPPLKYNIPSPTLLQQQQQQQQQKSLLKTTINTQRRLIDAKTGATVLTTTGTVVPQKSFQTAKQLSFSLPQGSKLVTASSTTTSTKTPFIVATSGGVQTLHVPPSNATAIASTNPTTASLTATVAGKRVALSKPIIINQINKTQQIQQQPQHQSQVTALNRANTTQIITTASKPQQHKQQPTQSFIIPINTANSNMQLQLQQQLLHSNASAPSLTRNSTMHKSGVHTIVVDSNTPTFTTINAAAATDSTKSTPKNIIRFLPNVKQQQQHQVVSNKLIGQRVISATNPSISTNNVTNSNVTMRGATKILSTVINNNSGNPPVSTNNQVQTTTLLPNNSTIVSTSNVGGIGNLPGTIIKMSPQAFNALQQKQQQQQQLQHIVKTSGANVTVTATQQQQRQQQRLIIGNTAIIAHGTGNTNTPKNINISQQQQQSQQLATPTTAKALGSTTIITNTKAVDVATSTTLTGPNNTNKVQMLNATNLTPQQQRMLIQNLKQQQQKQNMSTKPLAVVVSQTPTGITRVLKTSTTSTMGTSSPVTTTTTNATKIINKSTGATGQIVTLDSLLQQQQQQQQLSSSVDGNSGTIITPISATQFNNLIALGGGTQQRLITTQATSSGTNVIAGATTTTGGSNLRVIQTSSSGPSGAGGGGITTTGNTNRPTTFSIANIQGKQVVFATKSPGNTKQVTNIGQVITSTGNGSSGSVIFGGQTLKLQGNQITKTSGSVGSSGTSTPTSQSPQMQTVIMGNQILRVLPQSLVATKAVSKNETTNTLQSRLLAVGSNTNKASTSTTSVGTSTNLPKTLILGSSSNSGTQTIRLQNATRTSVASQQESTQTTSQKATATTTTGNRLVLAVQGGGPILLPPNFTSGGTLNLKSLQNMKLVSLTQVPQQLQDKSKTIVTSTTNSPKTVVKSIGSNNSTAIG